MKCRVLKSEAVKHEGGKVEQVMEERLIVDIWMKVRNK